jgi:hypothetical protein
MPTACSAGPPEGLSVVSQVIVARFANNLSLITGRYARNTAFRPIVSSMSKPRPGITNAGLALSLSSGDGRAQPSFEYGVTTVHGGYVRCLIPLPFESVNSIAPLGYWYYLWRDLSALVLTGLCRLPTNVWRSGKSWVAPHHGHEAICGQLPASPEAVTSKPTPAVLYSRYAYERASRQAARRTGSDLIPRRKFEYA